ncbi:heat shock 70 kDa protein 12A-like [Saccostrea echinata]|uniref:heat shock 70 kDa protein 12A-like n=1 Tax=Saccostrea echinata TaxID=191078 RepID=UPI002A7F5455|nr:heat shock 70 kDa protein 12A-like [Saccostrea echinata]
MQNNSYWFPRCFVVRGNRRLFLLQKLEELGRLKYVKVIRRSYDEAIFKRQVTTTNMGKSVRTRGSSLDQRLDDIWKEYKRQKEPNTEKKGDQKIISVAIDVGTSYSGYAYSFRSSPNEIFTNKWDTHAYEGFSHKAPSSILLDSTYNFKAFGYEAELEYSRLVSNQESEKYLFVKNFETRLMNDKGLDRNLLVRDVLKRYVPAHGLFIETIRFLKRHFLKALVSVRGLDFKEDDIQYVLTIPAIWSDVAKQIMRESANFAGIKCQNLELAYEPEVAALHCRSIPLENLCGSSNSLQEMLQPGRKFAVLDLGGGTADMTVEQNTLDGRLKHVLKASGGLWGGNRVNEEFCSYISEAIGQDIFNTFMTENICDFLYLNGQFETKKRHVTKHSTDKIIMHLPVTLSETYTEKSGKLLAKTIKNTIYSKDIDVNRGKIEISAEKVRSFFTKTVQGIVDHVRMVMSKPECKDIKHILMVGGFSESPLVVEEIRAQFPTKKVINPVDSSLSVLKGAVLFGFNTEVVTARACPLTYGISLYDSFDKTKHDISKSVMMGKERVVLGCFEKIFTIDEIVDVGTKRSINVYESYKGQPEALRKTNKEIEIFSSSEPNPLYVTELNCSRHGRIIVPPPNNRWPDKVRGRIEFEFGPTELIVRYVDRDTEYIVTGNVDFHATKTELDLLSSSVRKSVQ